MQSKLVSREGSPRMWVLVLAPGEEAKSTIVAFAKTHDLKAASFVALGAFERAKVGCFDGKKEYLPIPVDEQVEVISLVGDIAENDKHEADLHAHTVWAGMTADRGGHCWKELCGPPGSDADRNARASAAADASRYQRCLIEIG